MFAFRLVKILFTIGRYAVAWLASEACRWITWSTFAEFTVSTPESSHPVVGTDPG